MRSFRPILVPIVLTGVALTAGTRGVAGQVRNLAGTYRISICRGRCEPDDTARALAYGVLVLNDGPIKRLPDGAREVDDDEGYAPYNACFALVQAEHAHTLAGVEPAGGTHWSKERPDTVEMVLFRSPDSGYHAVFHVTPDGLRGRGHSWGLDISGHPPADSLAARRTGPPDPSLCTPSPVALARIKADMAHVSSLLGSGRPADPHPETTDAPPFARVTASGNHSCALSADGLAFCWGDNRNGVLGDGTVIDRLAAVPVAGGLRFTALSTGMEATCGISDGRAWCWGKNDAGQLGTAAAPDTCGGVACSLRPVPVDGGLRARAISVGDGHACALTDDGRAYCWGWNLAGALGTRTAKYHKTPVAVSGGLRFAAISAGDSFTCALTAEGAAYCWGVDVQGELGDGPTPGDCRDRDGRVLECRWAPVPVAGGLRFRSIAASGGSACGITLGGDAYCWGDNVRDVRTSPDQPGSRTYEPVRVPGTVRFASIVPPPWQGSICGLDGGGAAWCWGAPSMLFPARADSTRTAPVAVAPGHTFQQLALGSFHACGVEAGGAVFCWGLNVAGQLGNGQASWEAGPLSRVLLRK